ncbi:SDR family NAD(P)-dependent oxidoreductase [Actinoalloteichus fjordicus]|uniref:SDR family NAD(P)-dependent oxidoreductase n=1 Tax=Actinoalloteichus fjordicus TaxID=1612552 RepID=UPI0018DD1A8B|nr:SDR family NAD(P)-dependent oxidoreductase [Actinoalloteichus fjordicus]
MLVTGATGVVGRAILSTLWTRTSLSTTTVGRRAPSGMREKDEHHHVDLADSNEVEQVCVLIGRAPAAFQAVVFAAGVDSRQGAIDVDPAVFDQVMRVNCRSHLQILRAILSRREMDSPPLPVIAVSSDVVSDRQARTAVYAASKAALEEALRHAAADAALHVVLVRLAALEVPMAEIVEQGSVHRLLRPPPTAARLLATRIAESLLAPPDTGSSVEVWT